MPVLFDGTIDIEYSTTTNITTRTAIVAESFGLGVDETKSFKVYDKQHLVIHKGDIVFITGDSGGGKSSLLRYLFTHISKVAKCQSLPTNISKDEQLIEGVGKDVSDALNILTRAGLGDAFLMLRKYSELSDGQKYRYAIAKLINSNKDVWFIDEFCVMLDRELAKVIAYSLQKLARLLGKTLIVATTHTDIEQDLSPNLIVTKDFGGTVTVLWAPSAHSDHEYSGTKDIKFRLGNYREYTDSNLSVFHYKNNNQPAGLRNVWLAEKQGKIIGALITRTPILEIKERNWLNNKKYWKNYQQLNKDVEIISRVVLHPKYRGIGLGTRIVKTYLESDHSRKLVESIAVMSNYNPFFEKAGMTRVILENYKQPSTYTNLLKALTDLGFDNQLTGSATYNVTKVSKLTTKQKSDLVVVLMKEYRRVNRLYNIHDHILKALDDTIEKALKGKCTDTELGDFIKRCRKPNLAYYVWGNPKYLRFDDRFVPAIKAGQKTQTRRVTTDLTINDIISVDGTLIRVNKISDQPLKDISNEDAVREGFSRAVELKAWLMANYGISGIINDFNLKVIDFEVVNAKS